jgi:NAD(P)-dependent dehydrogenase (short-subunit alcohol dehydrogenase family)
VDSQKNGAPVAVISGGGTGIGLATARRLLADGYAVTAFGIDREAELPETLTFVEVDVSDEKAVERFSAGFPRVNALVNAAGMIAHNRGEFTMAGFRRVIDVNLHGTAACCFAFEGALKEARGAIVNFASMYAIFGSPFTPAYAASKGAVVQLTKSLAVAWGDSGVRVNAIAPGWIETRIAANAKANEERAQGILQRLPAKRWGSAAEVAGVIRFLLSEDASYVNGALYTIDGGYSVS